MRLSSAGAWGRGAYFAEASNYSYSYSYTVSSRGSL